MYRLNLSRLTREIVAKKFGPDKLVQKNMLVSLIKNELSRKKASSWELTQMSVSILYEVQTC